MPRKILLFVSQVYSLTILRPLQDAALARGDEVAWYYYNSEVYARFHRTDERCLLTTEEVIAFDADAVMVANNVVPEFFPGLKVQLFHGFNVSKRSDSKGHFRIRGFFDLYCTQGPATTEPFLELEKKNPHFRVVETGWPKLDPLFQNKLQHEKTEDSRPCLLVTSTFTPALSLTGPLYEQIRALAESGRWRLLVTLHPKMAPETVQRYRALQNENLTFVETDNILPLLDEADVMLSDTSSVVFEFLTLGKPVVTFRNNKPGPWLYNIEDPAVLEEALQIVLSSPPDLMTAIAGLTECIHPFRDGRSSERVLEAVDRFIDEDWAKSLERKPFNLYRRWKICRRLKYPFYKTIFETRKKNHW